MAVIKRGHKWHVSFRLGGKRIRKKSPLNTKSGAEAFEAQIRHRYIKGEPLFGESENKEKITFKEFAWMWFETYVKPSNKYSEMRGKRIILIKHLLPHFGKTPINEITNLQVEQFKAKKTQEGLTNKSINNYLGVFRKCLSDAVEWEKLEKVPKIKRLKARPAEFDFLTPEESRQLLNHAKGIWHEMILLALKTGLRYGELRALKWEDINWDAKILTVNRTIYRGVIDSPKSNKARPVPLIREVYLMLEKRKKKNGYIFADENGKILEENKPRRALWKACESDGLRRVGWHKLRHSFASHLVMAGASIKSVQDLLGHREIQTTMRYAHLTPEDLINAIKLLETKEPAENVGHNVSTNDSDQLKVLNWRKFINNDLAANIKQKPRIAEFKLSSGDGGN